MIVVCEVCGKEFDKLEHRIKRTKHGKHYCSRECYVKQPIVTWVKTGETKLCKGCGEEVYRSKAKLDLSTSGEYYCSKQCRATYASSLVQEILNVVCLNCGKEFHTSPSKLEKRLYCSRDCWSTYIRSEGPSYYRKFKKKVCDACGFIPIDRCQLDVHHLDENKKNNNEDNLVTICANCHRLLHKNNGTLGPKKNNGGGGCDL